MNVTYRCPHCDEATRAPLDEAPELACRHCGRKTPLRRPQSGREAEQPVDPDARLTRCLICDGRELYVRKDFPQHIGIAIIVAGFTAATIAFLMHRHVITLSILVASAVVDALLYSVTGNALHCYRCHSEYRGLGGLDRYNPFDLEIHERHRQEAARLGSQTPKPAAASDRPAERTD